jgi:hypothetical protein
VLLVGQQLWSRVEHVVRASRSRYCEWGSCSRLDPWHVLAASDRQKALSLLDHVVLVGPVRRRLHRQPLCRLRRPRPRIVVRPERPGKRASERAKREARSASESVRACERASVEFTAHLFFASSSHSPRPFFRRAVWRFMSSSIFTCSGSFLSTSASNCAIRASSSEEDIFSSDRV